MRRGAVFLYKLSFSGFSRLSLISSRLEAERGQGLSQKMGERHFRFESRATRLEHLVDSHYAFVLRLLTRLTGSAGAGEELAQATFAGLLRSWQPLGSSDEERAYVIRAAYNSWRRRNRRKRPELMDPALLDRFQAQEMTALDMVCAKESLQRVQAELSELPQNQRAALVLIVLEGMSYHQVAELMEVPRDTVSKWRTRALKRLRKALVGEAEPMTEAS